MNAIGFYNKAKSDLINGHPEHIEKYMLEATNINPDFTFLPTEVLLKTSSEIVNIANSQPQFYGAWFAIQLLRNIFYTKLISEDNFCFPDEKVFSKSGPVNRNKFYIMAFELFFKAQDYEKLYSLRTLYSSSIDSRILSFLDEAYLNLKFGTPLREIDSLDTLAPFMNHGFKGIYSYMCPDSIDVDNRSELEYRKICLKDVPLSNDVPVFAVYADEVYLNKFFLPYYESLCLVYGPGNFIIDATVVIIEDQGSECDFTHFLSCTDLCFNVIYLHDAQYGKDIFASIRFLDSISLIEKYSDVIITDIDAVLDKKLPKDSKNLSVACKTGDNVLPWRRYPAGAVRLKSSLEAKHFLEKVRAYLLHIYACNKNNNLWWVDQNALNYGMNELKKIKKIDIDTSFTTTSCFSFSSHADKKVLSSSAQTY